MDDQRIDEGLHQIHEAVIKYVLEFLTTGEFKNKTANAYMIAYSQVHRLADDEYDSSKKLFDYYLSTIKSYMLDSLRTMKNEKGERLVDMFLRENGQCKILIHWMRKVFTYLDKFYTKNSNIGSLCANAMRLYYESFFLPLKIPLFQAVNGLIESQRNCMPIDTYKIKSLLTIFEEIDMKNPELCKQGDNIYWVGESTLGVLNEWFKQNFITVTDVYICNKAKNEISTLSAPEYVRSSLKYLEEEQRRKEEYIHRNYHDALDKINFKYLMEENAKNLAKVNIKYK